MTNSITLNLTLISSSIFIYGPMSWESGWLQFEKPSMQGDVSQFVEKANHLIKSADTKDEVLELIETYESALKIEPKNREALSGIASYSNLIGLGYSDKKDEKRAYFLKAIKYSEQLMYLNPEFANFVDKGEKIWEACRVLSKNEINALMMFYVGTASLWKDCLNGLEKIMSIKWLFSGKKMMKTMMEIDPSWGGGTPYYAWANFYAVAPGFTGGDMKKAEEYYHKAIEMGSNMLNFKRTRALIFHTKNKDKKAFKKDLEWVLSQDPKKTSEYLTYPWRVFLQRDAKYMLDHIDDYFQ
jgi:tetratricopeptide (TPR) repeat protein